MGRKKKLHKIDPSLPPTELLNIGDTYNNLLKEIKVNTIADLCALGAVETYRRLKKTFPRKITEHALWSLEGALSDLPWEKVPEWRKAELRDEVTH